MASPDEHVAQAIHNRSAADHLIVSGDYDWAVTTLFYSALHYVQGYLVSIGIEVLGHRRRESRMAQLQQLESLVQPFGDLRRISEAARYDLRSFSREEVASIELTMYRPIAEGIARLQLANGFDSDASTTPEEHI